MPAVVAAFGVGDGVAWSLIVLVGGVTLVLIAWLSILALGDLFRRSDIETARRVLWVLAFLVLGIFAITIYVVARWKSVAGRWPRSARRLRLALRYYLLTLLAAIVLFPVYITVVNSLLRPDQIAARPPALFPDEPQWSSYRAAWTDGHMGRYLMNTVIVTVAIMVGQVLLSILAAYAFAFLEFPGRRVLFVVFLATMMIPFEVVFFTNYQTVGDLGLLNTYGGLILPFLATGFGAFLLRQSFLTVPRELSDAAALDGYGHWRFLWRVVVPLSRPTIAALSVFAFLAAWGQYLWPLVATDDEKARTVQVGLAQLRDTSLDQINVTFAGVVLASIPLVILLLLFQRQLVRGLTSGAVKG